MLLIALAASLGLQVGGVGRPTGSVRAPIAHMQLFKTPTSTDTAAKEQEARAAASNVSPKEYADATRSAANSHLASVGAHFEGAVGAGTQQASFLDLLWGVSSIPAVPEASASDPTRVLATVYEIGGPLTNVLSTSVAKQLPLIPHIGIRCYGTEYFYSDHIESRTVPVMEEMLGDRPQARLGTLMGGGAAVVITLVAAQLFAARLKSD